MWKRGKKRDEEVALSEGDESPKKSSKPSATAVDNDSDESDNIVVCELSKNRKVSVRNWNGKVVVDIRELYYKDGKEMPSKKGALFPQPCAITWFTRVLHMVIYYNHRNQINIGRQLMEAKFTILFALCSGISLTMDQWKVLRDHVDEINHEVAEN